MVNKISLYLPPESIWTKADWISRKDENIINYSDGRSGRINIVLYDNNGVSYDLRVSSLGEGLGFSWFSSDGKELKLPSDREYTKLKIRSDIALHVEKIEFNGRGVEGEIQNR